MDTIGATLILYGHYRRGLESSPREDNLLGFAREKQSEKIRAIRGKNQHRVLLVTQILTEGKSKNLKSGSAAKKIAVSSEKISQVCYS